MSIFVKLSQAVSDCEICWAAFKSAEQQAAEITAAVASRIAADRRQADERTATLTAQSKDPARPEVVRKLAQEELFRLQGRTFEPTADEIAAFAAAMEDAEAALRDFIATRRTLRDFFEQAGVELKAMRSSTLGDGSRDDELARRHLASEQRAFDLLGKTGRPGDVL